MAREMKMGIAVIGILLVVFCGLLAKRLTRPSKLPLSNAAANNAAATKSTPAKNFNPAVRPTVVTPQAEPNIGSSNLADSRGHDNSQGSGWPKPSENYIAGNSWQKNTIDQSAASATTMPPNLLANQVPIQDLNARPSKAVPYQTGYASDNPNAKNDTQPDARQTPYPASDTQSLNQNSADSIGAETSSRYPDYSLPDNGLPNSGKSTMVNDRFKDYRSTNSLPSSTTQRDSRYPSTNGSSQSFAESNTASPSSTNHNPNSQLGYSNDFQAGSTNSSQWQGSTVTTIQQEASAPIQRNGEKYTVQPNDTFWSISKRAYGSGAFFKALYEYNRKRHKAADELVLGQELLVPDENVLRRTYPDLCPRPRKTVASTEQRLISVSTRLRGTGRVYKAVEGDTLFEIARYELGKSSRWAEIYELNRDVLGDDFDYLRPGTELILPNDGARSDSITRQPEQIVPEQRSRY